MNQLRQFSTTASRTMPKFIAYIRDHPNVLDQRLAVRDEHIARAREALKQGVIFNAGGYTKTVPKAGEKPDILGSLLIFNVESEEKVWEALKSDVYYKNGIWNKDEIHVHPYLELTPN